MHESGHAAVSDELAAAGRPTHARVPRHLGVDVQKVRGIEASRLTVSTVSLHAPMWAGRSPGEQAVGLEHVLAVARDRAGGARAPQLTGSSLRLNDFGMLMATVRVIVMTRRRP